MLKRVITNCFILGLMTLFFGACDDSRVFEEYVDFEGATWAFSDTVIIPFEITDANSQYSLYANVRNSMDYGYSNLYIKYALVNKNGDTVSSDMTETSLMDLKTGEPFGSRSSALGHGTGAIYTNQVLLKEGFRFLDSGEYQVKMIQYMRDDDLQGIHAVGFRVENFKAE